MTAILAIDPGPTMSAYVVFDRDHIAPDELGDPLMDILANDVLMTTLREWHQEARWGNVPFLSAVAIERIEPRYGLNVGWETIETCEWVGRFAGVSHPTSALLKRSDILRHLGVASKGNADSGVRAALMDRWGGSSSVRKGGPLFRVRTHIWAAMAVAVTFHDMEEAER